MIVGPARAAGTVGPVRHHGEVPTSSFLPRAAMPGGALSVGPGPADPSWRPSMVVTDLDGTLLDDSGVRISPRNIDALRRAEAEGVRVVVATGRPIWWLDPVLEAGLSGTAICMNGAVVYDIHGDGIIASSPLTPVTMQDFVTALTVRTDAFTLAVERLGSTLESCVAEHDYDHPWAFGYFQRTDRATLLAEPAAKLLVRGPDDSGSLATLARTVSDGAVHVTYSTNAGLIEVASAGVNKGAAVAALAARWGIGPTQVAAFGDMPNDLEMLRWAGFPVAMRNAHRDVLAVATEVADYHYADGVAKVLERWF